MKSFSKALTPASPAVAKRMGTVLCTGRERGGAITNAVYHLPGPRGQNAAATICVTGAPAPAAGLYGRAALEHANRFHTVLSCQAPPRAVRS